MKPTANIILNCETLWAFPPKIKNELKKPTFTTASQTALEVSARAIRLLDKNKQKNHGQWERKEGRKERKKKACKLKKTKGKIISNLQMTWSYLYMEKSQRLPRKLLTQKSEPSDIGKCKISTWKSVCFYIPAI